MNKTRLTPSEVKARLQERPGWTFDEAGAAICRKFTFKNFIEAFAFMTRCALHAEKMDHHPEWSNVYKTVDVRLTTHSSKGVTELDFALAAFMDEAADYSAARHL